MTNLNIILRSTLLLAVKPLVMVVILLFIKIKIIYKDDLL